MKKFTLFSLLTIGLSVSAMAEVSTANLGACYGCHGANFEKVALGKSKIVKDMSKDDLITSLKGYKDGTYGGPMKGIMKGQVSKYSDEDLEVLASLIIPTETIVPDSNTTEVQK